MTMPGQPSDFELGEEFLEAFDAAAGAHMARQAFSNTNHYDPVDSKKKRLNEDLHAALIRLVKSIRDIK